MLKLYGYWRSTAAYRVRIALNYKQVPYENLSVHLIKDGGEQHQKAYRELNPQGLVPFLVDGDVRIGQSMAILEYLEHKYTDFKLMPVSQAESAVVRMLCQMIACDIHPLNNLRVLKYLTNDLNISDEEKNKWYAHWIHQGFSALEALLRKYSGQSFCFGDSMSLADCCLVPQVYNAHRFNVPLDDYPLISKINEHCLSLSAFQTASPERQPDAQS